MKVTMLEGLCRSSRKWHSSGSEKSRAYKHNFLLHPGKCHYESTILVCRPVKLSGISLQENEG
ncbi:hypothetical protein E2320_021506 [Naja naja]|nr:hypothetical protein E2320_021506 [Naja naja]